MYWLKWDSHLTSGTAKSRAPLWYNQNSLWSSLSSASLCVAWFSGTVLLCYRKRVTHWLQTKSLCSMSGKLWLAARVSCPLGGGGARLAFGWQPIQIPKCWEIENFSKRKKKCGAGKKKKRYLWLCCRNSKSRGWSWKTSPGSRGTGKESWDDLDKDFHQSDYIYMLISPPCPFSVQTIGRTDAAQSRIGGHLQVRIMFIYSYN